MRVSRWLFLSVCAVAIACGTSSTSKTSAGQSAGDGGTSSGGGFQRRRQLAGRTSGSSGGSVRSGSGSGGTQPDGGAVGGVPGGVAGPGTTVQGCEIFPTDNPWNVEIDGPDVQVIHTYDSQLPQSTHLHPDFGGYTTDNGGIPFNVVPATQADADDRLHALRERERPGPRRLDRRRTPSRRGAAMGDDRVAVLRRA